MLWSVTGWGKGVVGSGAEGGGEIALAAVGGAIGTGVVGVAIDGVVDGAVDGAVVAAFCVMGGAATGDGTGGRETLAEWPDGVLATLAIAPSALGSSPVSVISNHRRGCVVFLI